MLKTFYAVVANALAASLTNTFVWFAVTFWVYLETRSVIATQSWPVCTPPPSPSPACFSARWLGQSHLIPGGP